MSFLESVKIILFSHLSLAIRNFNSFKYLFFDLETGPTINPMKVSSS